jgi:predicted GNAT family N-acyltransferase
MTITVSVVTTPEALAQAFAIRSQVYIGEQKCPYDEEFDGNDFTATHFVAYIDGEPAGTLRVRGFSDYAKFERVAVLSRYRATDVARIMMEYSFEVIRRKGYTQACGYAQKRLVNYWSKYGFVPLRADKPFTFSDHEYLEVLITFEKHPDPINLYSDPYVAMRPEGAWDEPGILDKSAERKPTNPH